MAARLLLIVYLLPLAGCCLATVSGVGSESATGGAGTTGGTAATTSGTSTGSSIPTLVPTMLLDAGEGMVFGPIAITARFEPRGAGVASLGYSAGDGGQLTITVQTLGSDGRPLGDPIALATTNPGLPSLPILTVSDDGSETAACWEDFGTATNPFEGVCPNPGFEGQILLCASISDATGVVTDATYQACGALPMLVFNPTDRDLQLVYVGYQHSFAEWAYGQVQGCSISGPVYESLMGCPIAPGTDLFLLQGSAPGLADFSMSYVQCQNGGAQGGYSSWPSYSPIDPTFPSSGRFVAASNIDTETLGILELDEDAGLRGLTFPVQETNLGTVRPISASVPLTSPIAAGACASGFGYLAMTAGGSLLVAEQALDGRFIPNTVGLFALADFGSTVTSMAVAPNADGGLFLAVSSSAQIAVYLVGCQ